MNRFLWGIRPFRAALLAALLASVPCAARETIVRVGLPPAYEGQIQARASAAPPCLERATPCAHALRYRYALGADYQLLDWLQNGKVDAAVVSGLTLELMRRTAGTKFERDFFVATELPLSELRLRRTRVALRAEENGAALPDAEARLAKVFEDLLAGRSVDAAFELSSHLSAGAPELFARARNWLKSQANAGGSELSALDALMGGVLGRLRFRFEDTPGPALRFSLVDELGTAPEFLLARKSMLPQPIATSTSLRPALDAEAAFIDYLAGAARRASPGSELQRFAAGNYVSESIGWRTRFVFAFTLEELRGLLRRHEPRDAGEDDGIALVLTGGGVKAAYQTRLIDHLYGKSLLRNRLAPGEHNPNAVPVKFVVGTSGGALLGIFVASLDGTESKLDLSTKLWKVYEDGKPIRYLSSGNVFPKVDMLRWLSLLACLAIFCLVCWALLRWRRRRRDVPFAPRDGPGRFWRLSFWWLALLGVTPWLFVYVNGRHGQEHIPAIQGLFYFLFVLIAIHSDNRFITIDAPRAVDKPGWPPLLLGAAGAALVVAAVALRGSRVDAQPITLLHFEITLPALLACIAVLLVSWALHWWLFRRARWLQSVETCGVSAFALLVGVCLASYVPILAGIAPLFELTLDFWKYLALSALVVSLALAGLSLWERPRFLKRCFDFLLSAHPAQAVGDGRHARIIWGFVAGWFWWNLAVAPGAYGNDNARGYFEAAARNVFGPQKVGAAGEGSLDVDFHAVYVAPVTELHEGVERYVMFQPRPAYEAGAAGALLGANRNWLSISNDPRWIPIETYAEQRSLVMRVAFASGSPFPVFPPHRIALRPAGEKLFVDGGYAHNVPVEAAKRLGARRVLVISSSPRSIGARQSAEGPAFQPVGDFAWMVRWIVPYLYARSQVEDALSAEDLLVVSIAPSASADGWPFLTDFRDVVIKRMFAEAEQDLPRRIGSVENWGRPSFARRPAAS